MVYNTVHIYNKFLILTMKIIYLRTKNFGRRNSKANTSAYAMKRIYSTDLMYFTLLSLTIEGDTCSFVLVA